ncbi:amidohydrolase family protein [Prosthecomicrobium sp. N25]|uniref:amidohydrolase family protein n=1 Tax=Prosthecomicrobium sp. N25 TaxID=3129254 RepID=UPI003078A373
MPDFSIVDAHVHLYDPARLSYPWMASVPAIDRRMLPADYDAARAPVEVDRMVFVEVAVAPGAHLDEARFVRDLAEGETRIAGVVAHAPVEKGRAVEEDLDALMDLGRLRGIRRLIQDEPDAGIVLAPDFLEGVRSLAAHDLTFDLCIRHWQLPEAIELVRRCPEVRFVLDHIAKPGIAEGLREPWAAQIAELARLPNVVCKVSGVITEAGPAWTVASLRPYVEHVIECFGFARCLYGSDWPVSELSHRYVQWVEALDAILAGTPEADLRRFWRETAIRTYGLT